MFEGKFHPSGHAPADSEARFGADGLRSLGWDELVVRFSAARDFRRVVRDRNGAMEGSFDLPSARHLAALGDGQRGINPFALTNRKTGETKEDMVSSEPQTDDRGRA